MDATAFFEIIHNLIHRPLWITSSRFRNTEQSTPHARTTRSGDSPYGGL